MNIASKYSFVGAFIGRPPSNDRKFMMKINCINEIQNCSYFVTFISFNFQYYLYHYFCLNQPNDILLNQGCVNNTDFAGMVYIAVKKLKLITVLNTYNIFLNKRCISNRNVSV